jgi:hypothetical protein
LSDLHSIRRDNISQKWWRCGSSFGKWHDCKVEVTREQPIKQFRRALAQQQQSDLGVFCRQRPNRLDKRTLGHWVREPDAQEPVRFGVARGKRFQRLRPLKQISRLFENPRAERVQARWFYRAVEQFTT